MTKQVTYWTIALANVCFFVCLSSTDGQDSKKQQPNRQKGNRAKRIKDADLPYPPVFKNGKSFVTDQSRDFLKPPKTLRPNAEVAKTPPRIDFLFYPQQDYPGKPWSNWGDGSVANGKYYSAIGDHYAIGRGEQQYGTGTAFVYEYDPASRKIKTLVDISKFLKLPKGHYTPGKVHSRIDMGKDGWLYYATHRGSPRAANDANHYRGDWILRTHPESGKTEVVVRGPISKHSIPNSVVDSERMIFYGGTAAGPDAEKQDIQFFAYDLEKRKMLYAGANGPARYMILAKSTGCLYFVPGNKDGELMKYNPKTNAPSKSTGQTIGVRAATEETAMGKVYSVSSGQRNGDATIWEFDTRTEKVKEIGTVAVGGQAYVASLDVDPDGKFLYYVPGAHGGGFNDGSPVVQFDIQKRTRKVIAFLHPFYEKKYGFIPKGTYSTAVSETGDKVYITWNVSRGTRAWDCCGLAVVHIPEAER